MKVGREDGAAEIGVSCIIISKGWLRTVRHAAQSRTLSQCLDRLVGPLGCLKTLKAHEPPHVKLASPEQGIEHCVSEIGAPRLFEKEFPPVKVRHAI